MKHLVFDTNILILRKIRYLILTKRMKTYAKRWSHSKRKLYQALMTFAWLMIRGKDRMAFVFDFLSQTMSVFDFYWRLYSTLFGFTGPCLILFDLVTRDFLILFDLWEVLLSTLIDFLSVNFFDFAGLFWLCWSKQENFRLCSTFFRDIRFALVILWRSCLWSENSLVSLASCTSKNLYWIIIRHASELRAKKCDISSICPWFDPGRPMIQLRSTHDSIRFDPLSWVKTLYTRRKGPLYELSCTAHHGEPLLSPFLRTTCIFFLVIFLGWVFLSPQATSTDHGGPRTSDLSIERWRRNHFTTAPSWFDMFRHTIQPCPTHQMYYSIHL